MMAGVLIVGPLSILPHSLSSPFVKNCTESNLHTTGILLAPISEGSTMRTLIVDDDKTFCQFLAELLEDQRP
jgi:hypothetical protein